MARGIDRFAKCGALFLCSAWVVGCGGSERTAPTHAAEEPVTQLLEAEFDARPPLAAVTLEGTAVVVAVAEAPSDASAPSFRCIFGQTTAEGWDTPAARSVSLTGEAPRAISLLGDGPHVLVARAIGNAVEVSRVSPDGSVASLSTHEAPGAEVTALARVADGTLWVGWGGEAGLRAQKVTLQDGGGTSAPIDVTLPGHPTGTSDLAAINVAGQVLVAHATSSGLYVSAGGGAAQRLTEAPTRAVALSAPDVIAWTDDAGVHVGHLGSEGLRDVRMVDAGDRASEAAHRVGASLAISPAGPGDDATFFAYQDQSRGSLMTARAGEMVTRHEHPGRAHTRGFDVALVGTTDALLVLDVGLRTEGALSGRVHIDRLR